MSREKKLTLLQVHTLVLTVANIHPPSAICMHITWHKLPMPSSSSFDLLYNIRLRWNSIKSGTTYFFRFLFILMAPSSFDSGHPKGSSHAPSSSVGRCVLVRDNGERFVRLFSEIEVVQMIVLELVSVLDICVVIAPSALEQAKLIASLILNFKVHNHL